MPNFTLVLYLFSWPIVWIWVFFKLNPKSQLKNQTLFVAFFCGASLAFISQSFGLILNGSIQQNNLAFIFIKNLLLAPLVEESLKMGLLILFLRKRIINSPAQGLVYGVCLGLGFATLENLLYAFQGTVFSSDLALWYSVGSRAPFALILHLSTAALLGFVLALPVKELPKRLLWPLGFIFAFFIHALWNLSTSFDLTALGLNSDFPLQAIKPIQLVLLIVLLLILNLKVQNITLKSQIYKTLFLKILGFGFVMMAGLSFLFQKALIIKSEQSSEYQSVLHYLKHSPSVLSLTSDPLQNIKITDVKIHKINNQTGLKLKIKIRHHSQFKSADIILWEPQKANLIYQASLHDFEGHSHRLHSTYQRYLDFELSLKLNEPDLTETHFKILSSEIHSTAFIEFIDIKRHSVNPSFNNIETLFSKIETLPSDYEWPLKLTHAKLLHHSGLSQKAVDFLIQNIDLLKKVSATNNSSEIDFSNPFNLSALKLLMQEALAQIYYDSGFYDSSLNEVLQIKKQTQRLEEPFYLNEIQFLEALNRQALNDIKGARKIFEKMIQDLSNPNLNHKSWAHYYSAIAALKENQHDKALDHLETALSLNPRNELIRIKAIQYLIERNYPKDLEMALAMALRGTQIHDENEIFVFQASQLYQRLGLEDKTLKTE